MHASRCLIKWALLPWRGFYPHDLVTPQRLYLSTPSQRGLEFNICICGDTNIQSTALTNLSHLPREFSSQHLCIHPSDCKTKRLPPVFLGRAQKHSTSSASGSPQRTARNAFNRDVTGRIYPPAPHTHSRNTALQNQWSQAGAPLGDRLGVCTCAVPQDIPPQTHTP